MRILPIRTPLLKKDDDLAGALREANVIESGDILVASSKAVATVEGVAIDLSSFKPSKQAIAWSEKTGRSPAFMEVVLRETKRLNGRVVGTCTGALLCEVAPDGLARGVILTANAGLDESNIDMGHTVGWPLDPVASAKRLHDALGCAVIIGDSCCRPRRWGVTAFALTVCGLDPLKNEAGNSDLFGRKLRITTEAVADQLTTAANFIMGNADQATPAAVIRDHGIPPSDFCGWVDGIDPEEDLFRGIL